MPAGAADWRTSGGSEPSTSYDVMYAGEFPDTDPDAWPRIYFNVVLAGQNHPNLPGQTLGYSGEARLIPPGMEFGAYFGVWKDCNKDGGVGIAGGAFNSYPSYLLPANPGCRDSTLFNRDGVVQEMIWILPWSLPGVRVIVDEDVMIWGDSGRPGQPYSSTIDIGAVRRESDIVFVPTPSAPPSEGGFTPGDPLWVQGKARSLDQTDLLLLENDLSPAAPRWFTFYAQIGEVTRAMFDGWKSPAVYGAEACQGYTSGVRNGWDCDSTHWWDPTYQAWPSPKVGEWDFTPVPGTVYHFRDVDCYDGHVVAEAVFASFTPFSVEGTCPAPWTW